VSTALTWLFLAALLAATATRLWLARRQMRHVRAHRDAVPGMFAEAIPLPAHQKAADYTVAKGRFGMVEVLLSALVLSVIALQSLIGLPLALYRTFVIEERFGFNRMTLGLFLSDLVKQALIGIVLGVPLLLAVLWLMEQMGRYWWLYVWVVWTAFFLLLMMIYPAVILPLFNKFTPVPEGELASRIGALLERCGFKSRGLFVMDGSKRSSHGNAFFAGVGAGKRIVLFDTLVSRLNPPEVEAVLAHELGHYKLRHIAKMVLLNALLSFVWLWVLGQLIDKPWFYSGLGVATPSTAAALLLFLLVVPEFAFFLHPLISRYSRRREFEADAYAVQHADPADLVRALVKLYQDNAATLTPDPLHSAFYDSHPPAAIRIARLRTT
jgi:STE24 endopeptidase